MLDQGVTCISDERYIGMALLRTGVMSEGHYFGWALFCTGDASEECYLGHPLLGAFTSQPVLSLYKQCFY